MDYEKKYKEALERAKELIAKWTGKNKDFYIEDYAYIFPELAESKDERIRKGLIDALTVSNSVGELKFRLPEPTRKEAIAWLEKQKEKLNYSTTNRVTICPDGRVIRYTIGYLEKQKEPLHIPETCKENADSFTRKDERIRNQLINICNEWLRGKYSARPCLNNVRWLKNLLEKQKEQKPAWSEKDEKKRNGLIKGLEDRMGFGWASDPFSREEYIAWLKSLRPSWKPSEEQMKRLADAVESWRGGIGYNELKSLYNDLLKLK